MVASILDSISDPALKAEVEAFHRSFEPKVMVSTSGASETPKNLIYHYTSLEAAVKIITTNHMYFTERGHMNDSAEMRHAFNLGIAVTKDAAARLGNDNLDRIHKILAIDDNAELMNNRFFIACFSLEGNSLPQWRSYADDGRGIALGFEPTIRAGSSGGQANSMGVMIKYDDLGITKPFSDVLTLIHEMKSLNRASKSDRNLAIFSIAKMLSISLFLDGMEYKHSAYKFEGEYRLVIPTTKQEAMKDTTRNVRVRQGEVVHYISRPILPNVLDSLRAVTVGPAASESVVDQFKYLLESKNHNHINVDKSDIPYRSVRG